MATAPTSPSPTERMPVIYLPHGGGPWPFVEMGMRARGGMDELTAYLQSVGSVPPMKPKGLLVVSAHWEEPVPSVMTHPNPPMLYDYYGFPPASYEIQWPAPGAPALAARVQALLGEAGMQSKADAARGFDHGTFVPLKLAYPEPNIPTTQLSLKAGLDPAEHLAIGRALSPLRDEGVFIIGSGSSFHNLRDYMASKGGPASETFDAWLSDVAVRSPAERDELLKAWAKAPAARAAHPREEHLLPLMVIAGAAGQDIGTVAYSELFWGARLSAYHFG
ncbi:MAG: class III extradiol ring-cleavage dioxygenase [Polyangiaceae bacterium]|nr:class III extradiol ring-cleavage dioxygenase [Polyangiaceae bacterium]